MSPRREPSGKSGPLERQIGQAVESGQWREAATAAIQGYGPQILGYLFAITRDRDLAADAFSQFSEDLWRGIEQFRRDCSFRTWAYLLAWRAARRQANEAYRRRGRRLATSEISLLSAQVCSSSLSRLDDRLAEVRAGLAADEQTLLILRVDRGLSWVEVARVMAESDRPLDPATVRKRFERLKRRLRELAAGGVKAPPR
jgi:RNA polymerase sigma-70 factor (ECF subfamily)